MNGSGQVQRFSLVIVTTVALVFSLLLVGRATLVPAGAATTTSPTVTPTATKVKGHRVKIRIKGQRLGKKAEITLRGYRGNAKGVRRTVRVKKTKTVKRLKTGKYKVIAKKIQKNGGVAKAKKVEPKRVRVSKRCGARTTITYRITRKPTTGAISRISTDSIGNQGNHDSGASLLRRGITISPNGKQVAFGSRASNLVPGDTNARGDVFVKTLATGAITRISTNAQGSQGDGLSVDAVFSPNGEQVAFTSSAPNLVPGDTGNRMDVFVKTLASGEITRVSTDASGNPSNRTSGGAAFSPDGTQIGFASSRWEPESIEPYPSALFTKTLDTGAVTRLDTDVNGNPAKASSSRVTFSPDSTRVAFDSGWAYLVPGDTNWEKDVFVKNLATGAIALVSTSANGIQGNDASHSVVFSPDGKRVAFQSRASNLVPGDTNDDWDVFVKTLTAGAIKRVSTDRTGNQSNRHSKRVVFSPDGKRVAFQSRASNLVPGDTNDDWDVFVKTLTTGAIKRVSTDRTGNQSNGHSYGVVFSADGKRVAFSSEASNLVPGDTNKRTDVFVKTIP